MKYHANDKGYLSGMNFLEAFFSPSPSRLYSSLLIILLPIILIILPAIFVIYKMCSCYKKKVILNNHLVEYISTVHDLQKQIESLQEPLNEISSSNRLDEIQKDKIRIAIWRVNTMQNAINNILSLEKDSDWQKNLQSINGQENDKTAKGSFNSELESDDLYQSDIGKVSATDQSFLEKVFSIIRDHFDEPDFNVDVLSKHIGMSRSSFYNKIKIISDQAPADFIRQYRLERAKELLKQKKYTVAEVALNTGFSDVKYFRDVFRKKYKRSPSQYMKLN